MAKTRYKYMVPWDPKSPEEWAEELQIEPMEPLTVTRRAYDHMLGDEPYHTVETRWKGLHQLTDRRGERVLADECAVMDSGPKLGAALCITNHPEREATEEERARNRAHIQEVGNQVLRRMGIW